METEQKGPETPPSRPRRKTVWSRVRRVLIHGIAIFFLLFLLLQLPAFQNWLGKQVIRSISSTLNTEARLDNVRLAWLDELSINGLFIEDKYGDTLLFADEIRADFNMNPLVLFSRGLEIEELNISRTRFVIRRDIGDPESNLEYALERLFPPKDTPGKPLNLNLKRLALEDIAFVQADSVRGTHTDLWLESAVVRLELLNLPGKQIQINSAELYHPVYRLTNFSPTPLDSLSLSIEAIETIDSLAKAADDSLSLALDVGTVEIINGEFFLNNFRKDPIEVADISAIDFGRLGVTDIDLEIVDLALQRDTFTGQLKHISLTEKSGFTLEKLSVQDLTLAPTTLVANQIELLTPNSRLSDTLVFRYRRGWTDWADFDDRVRMQLNFDNSQVAVRDIMYFARQLRFNPFFRENRDRKLRLDGQLSGPVNSLRGRDVELALDENNYLKGNFSSSALTKRGEQFLQLDLDYAVTNMNTLRRLINNFSPPEAFDRLGTLRFDGRFDGFFTNFVAYGNLRTDIGSSTLDMNMDLVPGIRSAVYTGELQLRDFDLGVFLDNPEFGKVSVNGSIENGRGLVAETATAELTATLDSFAFREYTYRQGAISGELNRNFFNGDFRLQDENIDFHFAGELDFRDSIADLNFAAEVARLDLKALNLSQADLVLAGDVRLNLLNTRFKDMEGRLEVDRLHLVRDGIDEYDIDSLLAYSTFNESGQKVLALESDIANGKVVGQFDIDGLVGSLKKFMVSNYPEYANRLNIRPPRRPPGTNTFTYDLEILDSKGLNYLINPQLGPIRDLTAAGQYDGEGNILELELGVPRFYFGNLELKDPIIRVEAEGSEGDLDVAVDSTFINGKPQLGPITLLSVIQGDSINFGINYAANGSQVFDKLNLNGLLYLPDSLYWRVQFDSSRLDILQEPWEIKGNNAITFGKNYIDTRNFRLTSGDRVVTLQREGRQGLSLDMSNFELGLIDSVWAYPNLDFSGRFNVQATVQDIFKMEGISAIVRSDTFLMNGDDYGWMRLDASADNLKSQVNAYMSLNRDTSQLIAEAIFNLGDLVPDPQTNERRKNYLDLNIAINGYPLELADYWVGGSVSEVDGVFNAAMRVKGLTKRIDVSGYIEAFNGGFTVDFLKTHYTFDEAMVDITNSMFDAGGTILRDRLGNTATVEGGISHNRLKNLGLAAGLETDRFLALDLKKGDNALFYGRALGRGRITFTGNFRRPDIYVRAEVGEGSNLVIPADQAPEAGPISDVRFVNKKVYVDPEEEVVSESTGVNLEMELTVTEAASVEIIFDEEVGDKIQGNGRGNLRILVPRNGDMQMFGDYLISSGNYLFTFYRVVNKLFSVRPGGTIIWDGDPFGARIDLKADYEKLSTPILNFIQEYLVSGVNTDLENAARRATEVDLTLLLKGQLLQPEINFDLSFPNLDGQLETFANNKRRLLLLDQNELNRQVFGLIVVGQFLPADLSFSTQDVAFNTLSEWASNYFSLLINNLLSDAFGEDAFISTIDFDLAYSSYRSANFSQEASARGDVIELTLRKSFNRWTVSFSGGLNILSNNQLDLNQGSGTFFGNEFSLEYVINDARTVKLRFYQRLQPDLLSDRRLQFGMGLSWRKEFNTLSEFFRNLKKESEQ